MQQMLINLLKNLFFKNISEAMASDKGKPWYEKKRVLGSGAIAASGLFSTVFGYKLDPVLVNQFVIAILNLQDSVVQIVVVLKQSWPVLMVAYGVALAVYGQIDKNGRDKIAKLLGEPKTIDVAKSEQ